MVFGMGEIDLLLHLICDLVVCLLADTHYVIRYSYTDQFGAIYYYALHLVNIVYVRKINKVTKGDAGFK